MTESKIDIIITTRNSEGYIARLLDTIDSQSYRNFECFVIDDGSSDGTRAVVESYPWVKLICRDGNSGPAKNRNIAAASGDSPFIVFFDADVFLKDREWLAKAVKGIEEDEGIGQLASMIVSAGDEDILLDCGIAREGFLFRGIFHKRNKNHVFGKHLKARQVLGACTAGTILRRKDFEAVGGFDERYFYMSEDLDLSVRFFLSGKRVMYHPSLIVHHHESHVMGGDKDRKEFFYFRNNFLLLLDDYPLSLAFKKIAVFAAKFIVFGSINFILGFVLRKKRKIPFLSTKSVFKIFFSLLLFFPGSVKKRFSAKRYLKRARAELFALERGLLNDIRLKLPVSNLILSITNVCNAKCRMCFQHSVLNQKASLLSLDEIRRIVENCPDLKNVVLSGGEPFLRDDIDQLCRILIKSGNPVITIPTNGSLPEKMYAKVKEILAQDCKKLVVSLSLDGAKDFHDDNRGIPGLFAKVLESYAKLEALKGIYGDRLVIQVNTCVSKDNLDQIDALAELILAKFPRAEWMIEPVRGFFNERLVSPLNLDDWKGLNRKILEMDRRGVFLGRDADGIKRNYDYALRALESEKQPVPCCGGESFLYIDHEGKVYPCEFLPAVADLRKVDYDLNSLVAEKAWTECVEKIKNGDCYCTHFCWLSASVEKSEQRRSFVFAVKKFIAKHLD